MENTVTAKLQNHQSLFSICMRCLWVPRVFSNISNLMSAAKTLPHLWSAESLKWPVSVPCSAKLQYSETGERPVVHLLSLRYICSRVLTHYIFALQPRCPLHHLHHQLWQRWVFLCVPFRSQSLEGFKSPADVCSDQCVWCFQNREIRLGSVRGFAKHYLMCSSHWAMLLYIVLFLLHPLCICQWAFWMSALRLDMTSCCPASAPSCSVYLRGLRFFGRTEKAESCWTSLMATQMFAFNIRLLEGRFRAFLICT